MKNQMYKWKVIKFVQRSGGYRSRMQWRNFNSGTKCKNELCSNVFFSSHFSHLSFHSIQKDLRYSGAENTFLIAEKPTFLKSRCKKSKWKCFLLLNSNSLVTLALDELRLIYTTFLRCCLKGEGVTRKWEGDFISSSKLREYGYSQGFLALIRHYRCVLNKLND